MITEEETKRVVIAKVFTSDNEDDKTYEGRLLGLIDDKEFNSLLKSPQLQSKCITRESVPLSVITKQYQKLDGLRMVMAVKKVGNEVASKLLFISEKLDRVSYVKNENDAAFTGESDCSYIMIEEKEV